MANSTSAPKTFICAEHGRDLADKYEMFYQQQQMFDVTLIAEDDNTSFRAHRTFLSASSDYFRQRFTSTESDASQLQFSNMNGNTLKSILDFIYTGSIELNTNTIRNVLVAANLLKKKTLIAACLDFVGEQLNTRNCLDIALYAKQHHHSALETKSFAYAYQNFEKVCTEDAFLLLNDRQLNNFLSSYDQLRQAPSQEKLFLNLVAWYKHNEVRREKTIFGLLSQHVRFSILDIKFIEENRGKLSEITECSELMSSWLEWHTSDAIQKKTNIFLIYKEHINSKFGVQSYNSQLNQWSVEDWPNPSSTRTYYTTYVLNKKLIISGGFVNGEITNKVECLDLQFLQWYDLPPMISHRHSHCMIELKEYLYVIGGLDRKTKWMTSVEKYDISKGTWQNVASLPEEIKLGKPAVLNGLLYVSFGGIPKYYLQSYDPCHNTWSQTASKNQSVTNFGITPFKGCLYTVGGRNISNQGSRSVELYDPTNNKWTEIESLATEQYDIVCTTWNDRIIACGELRSEVKCTFALNEYNPISKTWRNLAPVLPAEKVTSWCSHLNII